MLAIALPSLALLLPWHASAPAHGQEVPTATATPTVTPTPTTTSIPLPSAKAEVAAAIKNIRKAGSMRATLTGTITGASPNGTKETETLTGRSDVSSTQHHIHSHSITSAPGAAPQRQETIDVGRWTADRTNNGPWSCQHAQTLDTKLYDLAQLITPLKSPWTITPDTVGAVPVWHVHARYLDPSLMETGHADYMFRQSDNRLIRGSITLKFSGQGVGTIKFTASFTLSHFGERVKVKVPEACRGSSVTTTIPPPLAAWPGWS